ncbi:MAG TPA: cation diffusion facilitator family transporter [Verrucomicrobiae bacterium]|nr:cation diffusion facilitator family transporter [Verrucomicrobiae bacterium]
MNSIRVQRSVRATIVGLATNVLLAVTKLLTGIFGHSYALVADAIESMADSASSIIVWRAVVIAERPADEEHPYGHGKAEAVAAAAVSAMLLAAALLILVRSVKEILAPHHAPEPYTLYVLLGVVLVKETLFRFVGRVGEEIESSAVQADAWHHRSDAITSAAAALGISIALVGGENYRSADDWAAIFAAFIIAFNGFRLLRPAVDELMDAAPREDIVGVARAVALKVQGVKGVEKCLARKMGYGFLVDMHIEVDGELPVSVAHELAHTVKNAIRTKLPRVLDVTIHIEPFTGPRVSS